MFALYDSDNDTIDWFGAETHYFYNILTVQIDDDNDDIEATFDLRLISNTRIEPTTYCIAESGADRCIGKRTAHIVNYTGRYDTILKIGPIIKHTYNLFVIIISLMLVTGVGKNLVAPGEVTNYVLTLLCRVLVDIEKNGFVCNCYTY